MDFGDDADLLSGFFGGGFGPGVRVQFTSMGPGGRTTFYTNMGGNGMRGGPRSQMQQQRNGFHQEQREPEPQSLLQNIIGKIYSFFFYSMVCSMVFGVNPIQLLIRLVSFLMMGNTNVDKYDFSPEFSQANPVKLQTQTLNLDFFVSDSSYSKISSLSQQE